MAVHRNQVAALLGGLSPLQEKIVRLYFGIGCERSHSASEIAREFQVSSQVIGGILAGAQRRLAKVGYAIIAGLGMETSEKIVTISSTSKPVGR
jgi:DNA-directed RNA polymerase sigma subunit (sigma70/sigma32)